MTEFPMQWDTELADGARPVWFGRGYMNGSLIDVDHLVTVVDAVLRGGATLSIPSVTLAPRPPARRSDAHPSPPSGLETADRAGSSRSASRPGTTRSCPALK